MDEKELQRCLVGLTIKEIEADENGMYMTFESGILLKVTPGAYPVLCYDIKEGEHNG